MRVTNESVEDYLETILILSQKLPVVRAIDVVSELGYSKSSVSTALKNMREKALVRVEEHGYIYLTDTGREIATEVYERHLWFTRWLISLGVSETAANVDACHLEHALSKESFEAIKKGIGNIE